MMEEKQCFVSFRSKLLTTILILAGMFTLAMVLGAGDISPKDVWTALTTNEIKDKILIIREIRFPREVAAVFVGAALAVSGAIMQGITKNPLADPGLLGLSAGSNAALAITIAFLPFVNYYGIIMACFIGAAFGGIFVFGVSSIKKGGFTSFRIVLAGVAVSTFLNALAEGISIYFRISKEVSMWTAGGMIGTSWRQLQIMTPFILIGILITLLLSRQLTTISLSEETAVGLGQNTTQIKVILFIINVLLVGASVALAGNIAFIGLMIPHIARLIVGSDYRFIIPMSVILGSTLMLFADTLARTINAPFETPVAAIASMMGLPFFLFIAHKGGKTFL